MNKMGFESQRRVKFDFNNRYVKSVVDGIAVTFRSEFEYKYARYLDLLKTENKIKDWDYEGKIRKWGEHKFIFKNVETAPVQYTPDFMIRNNDNTFEYHETKGYLLKYDITKFKRMWEQRPEVVLVLIFQKKPKISVNKKAKIIRYCSRIVWNAEKELFRGMF